MYLSGTALARHKPGPKFDPQHRGKKNLYLLEDLQSAVHTVDTKEQKVCGRHSAVLDPFYPCLLEMGHLSHFLTNFRNADSFSHPQSIVHYPEPSN